MNEFENGLLRVGHSSVIHLINPVPSPDPAPLCKPKGTSGIVFPVVHANEANCKRCKRKAKANA